MHNPFEKLKDLRASLPDPKPADLPAPAPPKQAAAPKTIPRAVVRLERSGRGGKEVTVIEHLDVPPAAREEWLKALKSSLGCGGVIEGTAIVLQGDQRKRLPKILEARGVKKVTVA